jgi:hypothetical protein
MADPQIRIRRSSVPAKRPTVEQLQSGELAINTFDGRVFLKQDQGAVGVGTRVIEVGAGSSVGKTIFVSANGNDDNTGLNEVDAKASIKSAASIAQSGDTIKVYPGYYVENNPVIIPKNVSIEGTELRNCQITPQNTSEDLFHVNNGVHVTDLSFVGPGMAKTAAVISFQPLVGVSSNRFFDAARLIRMNLDFIAKETVGYLTSTDYRDPVFSVTPGTPSDCADDIKDVYRAICHDITRGGNSKCVGAGKSYYTEAGALQHIVGVKTETIDAFNYSAGIARAVINNATWGGQGVGSSIAVTNATYHKETGITTITAAGHNLSVDDPVYIVGLGFTCDSDGGVSVVTYPDNSFGYVFPVRSVIDTDTFSVVVGISTLDHYYNSGGTIQKRQNYQSEFSQVRDLGIQADPSTGFNNAINGCANVVSAIYSCVGVVTTIIDGGLGVLGVGINTTYPGNSGLGTSVENDPSFSPGVGPITQGPYIRNCTNFIADSVGMRVDGFHAEPGDKDDVGVTGAMSVDSYTQYNQGGIGVSISNGAYAQLVSIFTICDDIAIYTDNGGQCDLTNSNSSFGTKGLVSIGVGGSTSKSIYRMTGNVYTEAAIDTDQVVLSGIGTYRPYDGQAMYFGELYYTINSINVTNGGSGYNPNNPPTIIISDPSGPSGIKAEASANVSAAGTITSIDVIATGNQFELDSPPSIAIGGTGGATAEAVLQPIYYSVESATVPSGGISTVTLRTVLDFSVSAGTTAFISRQSLQIASSHSFEYIGSGNNIFEAKPALGGVTIQDNEVVFEDGGLVVYTSTDQAGNFRIGDGVAVNQFTGTISGRDFDQSLLNTVTPLIIALDQLG